MQSSVSTWDIYLKKGDTADAEFHMQQASTLTEEMGFTTLVPSMSRIRNILEEQTSTDRQG